MVPRYSRLAMTAIWQPENRFRIWFDIEVYAAEAMGEIGMIPADEARKIVEAHARGIINPVDVPAIDAIEAVTKHDVIAFLTWIGERLGPEKRWLHQGMTSSDVLDTALSLQLAQASAIPLGGTDQPPALLERRGW